MLQKLRPCRLAAILSVTAVCSSLFSPPVFGERRQARTIDGQIFEYEVPDNLHEAVKSGGSFSAEYPPGHGSPRTLRDVVAGSTLIAELRVFESRSFLSDNGKWIFTEITGYVDRTFLGHWFLSDPMRIILLGGRVHFPEGDAEIMQSEFDSGLPRKGKSYVVFLTPDTSHPGAFSLSEGAFSLYRISTDRIVPACTVYPPSRDYLGMDYSDFQSAIATAIEQSNRDTIPRRGGSP